MFNDDTTFLAFVESAIIELHWEMKAPSQSPFAQNIPVASHRCFYFDKFIMAICHPLVGCVARCMINAKPFHENFVFASRFNQKMKRGGLKHAGKIKMAKNEK